MSEHWDGRFPVKISESSDLFMLTFGCEGDKLVIRCEPFHFQNHHVVLHTPVVGLNFNSDDLKFTPFWVQVYRLPFLSKTKTLAVALGNIIGKFEDVFEDSLNEDKFWVDFRYERLPEYCMECGIIGHPYNKCSVFLEKLDNGEEPALEYQPFIKGSPLPTSSYDRYRTDFAKGDAWPLLTRLAKKSFTAAVPQLHLHGHPQPRPLYAGESLHATERDDLNSNSPTNRIVQTPVVKPPSICFQPSLLHNSTIPCPTSSVSLDRRSNVPHGPPNFTDLSSIYIPITTNPPPCNAFATYPPTCQSTNFPNKQIMVTSTHLPLVSNSTTHPATAVMNISGKENSSPNVQSKRQNESLSLRQTLKRCRGNIVNDHESTLSVDENERLRVSTDFMDSVGDEDFSAETVLHLLNFNNGLEVPRVGLSGGLMLLWKDDVDVSLNNFNVNVFDRYMAFHNGPCWHFTAFYGAPSLANRRHTWTLLKRLKDIAPLLPWMVIGDFNEILYSHNKQGGHLRSANQMDEFRSVLDSCQLNEQQFHGDPFTWIKGRHNVDTIKERLDWCFTNDSWNSHFQPLVTSHLDYYSSDHRAIAVNVLVIGSKQKTSPRKTRFRFEKMWLKDEEAATIIRRNWSADIAGNVAGFLHNLSSCTEALQQWHSQKFGQMKRDISHMQKSVASQIIKRIRSPSHVSQLKNSEAILDELLAKEEEYWHQSSDAIHTVLDAIPATITPTMNLSLTRPFTSDEVVAALHSMSPDKSPGSDGMSAMFYQNYWSIVGDSVTEIVLGILNEGTDMSQLNKSIITLIPKVPNPTGLSDYRPISLCNVIYKLISKTIVLRFQKVLPFVISETQSAFLSNRLITDNILVAFELVHHLRHKTQEKVGFAALKLDMSKAFDRVEWKYLEAVMLKMGFASQWVTLIMNCITTSSFSFSLNGEVVGHVQPHRGLHKSGTAQFLNCCLCNRFPPWITPEQKHWPTPPLPRFYRFLPPANRPQEQVSWSAPRFNGFKLNIDAATNTDQKLLGIGAILRDHNGMVIAALSKNVQETFRSDEMEAKALFHALNCTHNYNLSSHIETDALRVSTMT
uniref:Reverse transcriptase domain-containing protein n=1 Tax=Cannabis sativa TaxID=3483 RepID=A0A803PS53_CANSA